MGKKDNGKSRRRNSEVTEKIDEGMVGVQEKEEKMRKMKTRQKGRHERGKPTRMMKGE